MLNIDIKVSRIFLWLLSLLFIGSVIITATLPCAGWIKCIAALATAVYGISIYHRYGLLKHKHSIINLRIHEHQWTITDRVKSYAVELCGSSTVTRYITILRFKLAEEKNKRVCIVFYDSMSKDQYRQMIIKTH